MRSHGSSPSVTIRANLFQLWRNIETLSKCTICNYLCKLFFNLKETYVKTHWWKTTQLQWVQLFSCKIQLSEDACWMFAHKIDICSYSYMLDQLAWRCIFKGFLQKRGLKPMLKNPTQNIWSVAEVLAFYENKLTTKRWQTIAIVIAIHETTSTGWDIFYFIFSSFVIVLKKLGMTSSFKKFEI